MSRIAMQGPAARKRWVLCVLAMLALAGCGDSDADGAYGGGGGSGGNAFSDGGGGAGGAAEGAGGGGGGNPTAGMDGLSSELFADPERVPPDFDADAGAAHLELARDCYAGSACAPGPCEALAACCVGSGSCCSPVDSPALPSLLDFTICEGLDAESCAEGQQTLAAPFGPAAPVLTARGLVPNGSLLADGGTALGEPVDLAAHRVDVSVQFTLPPTCGSSCLESAGISWTGTDPRIRFDNALGLLLSGARGEVSLLIGESLVESFAAGNDGTIWTLRVEPDGHVEVLRDGQLQSRRSVEVSPLRQARLAVFGRNLNDPSVGAAVATLGVSLALCDMPTAWQPSSALQISDELGLRAEDSLGSGPSLASDGTETRVVYALDGELFWGRRTAEPGSIELIDAGSALSAVYPHEELGVRDPELVWDGSRWHLFYTAEDAQGRTHIGHATAAPGDLIFSAEPAPSLSPLPSWPEPSTSEVQAHMAQTGIAGFDAPSVYFREGLWLLVVRAHLLDSSSELRVYYATDLSSGFNEDWAPIAGVELGPLTRISAPTEELTDPSLIVHNGAYQLYYARRRGTRWALELLSSDDLVAWRSLGEVLAGSGNGFDSLGASSPDARSNGDRIELLFQGHDGVASSLGYSSRLANAQSVQSP